jgi:hypothetical protein
MSKNMMFNKAAIALAVLGSSASALAAHPGDAMTLSAAKAGANVTAPRQAAYWSAAVEFSSYTMGNSDYQWIVDLDQISSATPTLDQYRAHSVEMNNEWGFKLEGAYHFAGNGRDISLSYRMLQDRESDHFNGEGDSYIATDWWWTSTESDNLGSFEEDSADSDGRSFGKVRETDLVFGQKIDMGHRVSIHPFGGLRYGAVEVRDRGEYRSTVTDGLEYRFDRYVSDFVGLGLRFGSDASVMIGRGFSFTGKLGVSLLVGDMNQRGSMLDMNSNLSITDIDTFRTDSQTRVVPEVDSRLAVNYAFGLTDSLNAELELGYEASNYFGVTNKNLIAYTNNVADAQNFGFYGPYLRVHVDLI